MSRGDAVGRRLARRLRSESGQASSELLGMLPYLLLAILVVWQVLLGAWAFLAASNAARTVSRIQARVADSDSEKAARNAVSPGLRRGLKVEVRGDRATVRVRIPIVVPGITAKSLTASRSAELPGPRAGSPSAEGAA